MKLDIVLNALAIILFIGFGMASFIAFTTIDKQKEITIMSRYGRQTEPLEILFVNIGLLLVAGMLTFKTYRFLPALVMFVLLIFLNSRVKSGVSPAGVFIGTAFLPFDRIEGYRVVNDELSTIRVLVYANQKCYVLRCEKEQRRQLELLFKKNGISMKQEEEAYHETFN